MPGASPTRAAVFTRSPQSVEVYEQGAWWPGSMLGWRHDASGTCQAWVRVEFAGVVEDAWVELTLLRLPESPASDVVRTQHLPLVRDGAGAPTGHRLPPAGGRRRAPETGELPAAPAPEPSSAVPAAPVAPLVHGRPLMGRHRAPAGPGRHRAAEAGVSGAVPADLGRDAVRHRSGPTSPSEHWAPPPPRSELPPAGPVVRPTSVRPDVERDLLTRPLRLQEGVGTARPSRRDSLPV